MRAEVEVVTVHRDSRGAVFEPLDADRLAGQQNVHVVLSEPGEVRGNHYHRLGTEQLIVQGPALVRLRESGTVSDRRVPEGEVWRFVIPPRVSHAIRHEGPDTGVMVGFNSEAHNPEHPDVVWDVILEGS